MSLAAHQLEGAAIAAAALITNKAFLLADDVGVGKTRTACVIAKVFKKVLIVTPLSTFGGWLKEAAAVDLKIAQIGIMWPGTQCVMLNYEQLGKWKEIGEMFTDGTFHAKEFDLIIWDEAQNLKGIKTKRHQIWTELNAKCGRALYLTATPGQTPMDLVYLKDVVPFDSYWHWVRSFKGVRERKIGRKICGLEYRPGDEGDKAKLEAIVKGNPRALRRLPSDIAGWPELQRVIFPVQLNAEEGAAYGRAMEDYISDLEADGKAFLAGKVKGDKDMHKLIAAGQFRKRVSDLRVRATVDLAKTLLEQGKAVPIHAEYLNAVDLIKEGLKDYRVGAITGSTPESTRQTILRMSAEDSLDVIIFTPSEGINLQQMKDHHRGRVQINHDVAWSAIKQVQIDGRCHRAGRSALVYWMACAGTIDDRIAKVLQSRMDTVDIINGDIEPSDYILGEPINA